MSVTVLMKPFEVMELKTNESNDDNFDENSITRETFHLTLEVNIRLRVLKLRFCFKISIEES